MNHARPDVEGEILHDFFGVREGGGKLALTLAAHWGWPVAGGFVSDRIPFAREWPDVALHDLGVRPGIQPFQALRLARFWRRYRSPAQTILYSGTYSPMAVINHADRRNMYYCHTPPRFIYDQRSFYIASTPRWQQLVLRLLVRYLQPRYESAVRSMDRIIVNSRNVQRRLQEHLGFSSVVVHPPCDVHRYRWREPDGYYLSTSRLDGLKRVDLVVKAFRKMGDRKLLIASGGSQRRRLEKLAAGASNIVFMGEVDDNRLRDLISRCIATIYVPRDEDFGMSPVESMAAGKPVIGVAEGGLVETIVDGQTGILVPPDPDVEHLKEAICRLTPEIANGMRYDCEQRAKMFRTEVFLDKMSEVVNGS